ncbi:MULTISPECIES: ATP-grasp domain-containing protein [Micromonospora]|uniref:ATP-grasp domain-containing protein n=1 Tax=Micromonospora haikouensis TaxID=686309 RepID=A0A0D0V1S5_9ACTN|nr:MULTISPECIES: ATP-grasp domain-containing protein [Micromonospora]KIR64922.1 hypothetical protein TK50_04985 [Micromonospora haikouensis]
MPDQRLLVLGFVENREFAIRTLLRSGVRLLLVDFVDAPHLRLADDYRSVADLFDERQVRAAVADLLDGEVPSGIMTFFDECMILAADLAAEFAVPFMSRDAAAAATIKSLQRSALRAAGVPQPRFRVCPSLAEVREAAHDFGFPVCVKPVDQAGSIGVGMAASPAALEVVAARAWERRLRPDSPVLVEERVTGQEISVESLTCDGETTVLCQVRKEVVPGDYPIVRGHALPFRHADADAAEAAVRTGLTALGVDRCFSNSELILTERGPVVIEINARTPGDVIMDMIWHASGFDPYRAALEMALGGRPDVRLRWRHHEAMRFLCSRKGRLLRLDGVERARRMAGAVETRLMTPIGSELREARDNMDHIAFVVARGALLEESSERAEAMLRELTVVTG